MSNLFVYDENFLSAEETTRIKSIFNDLNFIAYKIRGKELKARPKIEFAKDASGLVYRWGQQADYYDKGFTHFHPLLQALVDKIGDTGINHIIVTKYTNGCVNHIPWHHDKQEGVPGAGAKDIKAGTKIYNVIVCDSPRRFQLADPDKIDNKTQDASEYAFDRDMPDGSLMTLTSEGNMQLKHRVPKDKAWTGLRYSIVLRTLKTADFQATKKRKIS